MPSRREEILEELRLEAAAWNAVHAAGATVEYTQGYGKNPKRERGKTTSDASVSQQGQVVVWVAGSAAPIAISRLRVVDEEEGADVRV